MSRFLEALRGKKGDSDSGNDHDTESIQPREREGQPDSRQEPLQVLLLDLDSPVEDCLDGRGLSLSKGSLGTLYKVEKADSHVPVLHNGRLPENWAESDIIIADLSCGHIYEEAKGEQRQSLGESGWWAPASRGIVDPRPMMARRIRPKVERILVHGGVLVLFMDAPVQTRFAQAYSSGTRLHKEVELDHAPWSLVDFLDKWLVVSSDEGESVKLEDSLSALGFSIAEHLAQCKYTATLRFSVYDEAAVPILENKFGQAVGSIVRPEGSDGNILLLPQFEDKGAVLEALFEDFIPRLAPGLFPNNVARVWLHSAEIEHPAILERQASIEDIREEAETRIRSLENEIAEIRVKRNDVHSILTESGNALVVAVKDSLERIGFENVILSDKERRELGEQEREDLRIEDRDTLLLAEVKGLMGQPTDEDCLQVGKYLAPTMRETGSTSVVGISIINHERFKAPNKRKRDPFRELVIAAAAEQGIGLLTTIDLFHIVRNMESCGWPKEAVLPLFYQSGRIEALPTHYEFAGTLAKKWPEAGVYGVELSTHISIDDALAVEKEVVFHEFNIQSMQIDDEDIREADVGMGVGIRPSEFDDDVRSGTRVFRVTNGVAR